MNSERELLARHLRELLALVENNESDLSHICDRTLYWWFDHPIAGEIASRLRRIESRLESLEPQRCAFAERNRADRSLHLLTGVKGRLREELNYIKSWLSKAKQLTVVDPYFFSFSGSNKVYKTPAQYVETIIELLPKNLEYIEVFHSPEPNQKIFSPFKKYCRNKNITLLNWPTTEVHDRVLIKNETEAIVLGTSFGGFGNKIAFVLDLPQEDLKVFRHELHRIKEQSKR